jgi:2-keto-3-deoxy-L-rhamnonate aldolase RhmA
MKRSSVLVWVFGWVFVLNVLWGQSAGHAREKAPYNPVRQKIERGQIVKGMYVTMKDPFIAKVFARAGFDFIWIDLEHTSLGWHQAEEIIQAICDSDVVPIIRVPWNEHYFIKRALDIGAKGIIVPMVNTKEQAVAAVQACRYPPQGIRGFGPDKAAFYWGIDTREYIRVANNEILVIVQVEDKAAIGNIEEIFSVPGVDLAPW